MKIQLFMCCHRSYEIIPPLCRPIQCGAALNAPVTGAVADNMGDNISERNREYCELTAHYYAWKNIVADYYGFCHYRRFLCSDFKSKYPYIVRGSLSPVERQRLFSDEKYWRELISQYDLIVPCSEDMGISAKKHYITSRFHYEDDLELFLEILHKRASQLIQAADEYLSQDRQYFCNMFIMNHANFQEYCGLLFPILEEFDAKKKLHGDFQSDRTNGYLGEIFTGIYINFCYKRGERVKELPRVDVSCTLKKRVCYHLFPPESRRRFIMKRFVKMLRGN